VQTSLSCAAPAVVGHAVLLEDLEVLLALLARAPLIADVPAGLEEVTALAPRYGLGGQPYLPALEAPVELALDGFD
jgi:hypothetical protein